MAPSAYEVSIHDFTWPAAADLSAKQFHAVQLTTSETIDIADATVRCVGILQNAPVAGEAAHVRLVGISRMVVDGNAGAIAAMDAIAPSAAGLGLKTTSDNDEIVAVALQPSTAANDVIAVLVKSLQRY
jgi:hypothetical protein